MFKKCPPLNVNKRLFNIVFAVVVIAFIDFSTDSIAVVTKFDNRSSFNKQIWDQPEKFCTKNDLDPLVTKIKEGSLVLVATGCNENLDFTKTQFLMLDIPGNVRPKTLKLDWTNFNSTLHELKSYGFKYFLIQNPKSGESFYSIKFWEKNVRPVIRMWRKEYLENSHQYNWNKHMKDYFSFLEKLKESQISRHESGPLILYEL